MLEACCSAPAGLVLRADAGAERSVFGIPFIDDYLRLCTVFSGVECQRRRSLRRPLCVPALAGYGDVVVIARFSTAFMAICGKRCNRAAAQVRPKPMTVAGVTRCRGFELGNIRRCLVHWQTPKYPVNVNPLIALTARYNGGLRSFPQLGHGFSVVGVFQSDRSLIFFLSSAYGWIAVRR